MLAGSLFTTTARAAHATDFDVYGQAPAELVAIGSGPELVFEVGLGGKMAPSYEGSSEYSLSPSPIIDVERLIIPGLIDIGGDNSSAGGFNFAPSIGIVGERNSADFVALNGLNDIDPTYALGAKIGYEMILTDLFSAEIYGAGRYAFGGAEGLVGEVGLDITGKLTPQLTVVGGPVVNLASQGYMDTYFGVTGPEAVASGGRLAAYDPAGGIKSVGAQISAKYEFVPDTFLNLNASYSRFIGDAVNSPIVQNGSRDQFTVGLGLSRRLSFDY